MSNPFIGEVVMFGGNFAPRGWSLCDGQLLAIAQYQALFSLLGTTYGGDGRVTFALPDLRGRAPMHAGTGPGLTPRPLGQRSGQETHTLTLNELPSHNHSVAMHLAAGTANTTTGANNPIGNISAADIFDNEDDVGNKTLKGIVQQNVGGGQSHNNMQPYLVVNFIIAMTGVFPSRN